MLNFILDELLLFTPLLAASFQIVRTGVIEMNVIIFYFIVIFSAVNPDFLIFVLYKSFFLELAEDLGTDCLLPFIFFFSFLLPFQNLQKKHDFYGEILPYLEKACI